MILDARALEAAGVAFPKRCRLAHAVPSAGEVCWANSAASWPGAPAAPRHGAPGWCFLGPERQGRAWGSALSLASRPGSRPGPVSPASGQLHEKSSLSQPCRGPSQEWPGISLNVGDSPVQ